MNGLTKTIIALLPAAAVHALAFFLRDSSLNEELMLVLIIGLLVLGGILAATFLVGAMFKNKEGNMVLPVILFIVFLVGYVATFFFTGCLVAVSGMNFH